MIFISLHTKIDCIKCSQDINVSQSQVFVGLKMTYVVWMVCYVE